MLRKIGARGARGMLIKQSQATCGLVLQGGPEEAVITVIAGGKQSASFAMMTSAPGYSLLPMWIIAPIWMESVLMAADGLGVVELDDKKMFINQSCCS